MKAENNVPANRQVLWLCYCIYFYIIKLIIWRYLKKMRSTSIYGMSAIQEPQNSTWDTSRWYQYFLCKCYRKDRNTHSIPCTYFGTFSICLQLWIYILICIIFLFLFLYTTFYSTVIIDCIYSLGIVMYRSETYWNHWCNLSSVFPHKDDIFFSIYAHSSF